MDVKPYRKMLIAKERELLTYLERTVSFRRELAEPGGLDTGDESVYSQQKELLFAQVDANTQLLAEVRSALVRIDEGSYGECLADGELIPKARLDVVPWASCCVEHQGLLDNQSELRAA